MIGGSRHAQVTRSPNGLTNWGKWKTLKFIDLQFRPMFDNNIYYMAASKMNETMLVAYFTGVFLKQDTGPYELEHELTMARRQE